MLCLEDGKESQLPNPFIGGGSLALVLLEYAIGMEKSRFLGGFNLNSKLRKDASLVYHKMIELLNTLTPQNIKEWVRWLERPRNKWGDSPLEKAMANIFFQFLAVKSKLHFILTPSPLFLHPKILTLNFGTCRNI